MLFFTRELHDGFQDDSGWTRSATTKLHRNLRLYKSYQKLIRPFLPPSILRLQKLELHDCEVVASHWSKQKLILVLDTVGEEKSFPERYVQLSFVGVRTAPNRLPQKKEWWNAEEIHLGDRSKFWLHVRFTSTEIEIPADEVKFKFSNSLPLSK